MRDTASRTARRTTPEGVRLGERLRQLRVAAGLTQSEVAGDRFSKEYVSQIERGKTRPTAGTIEWLADRLGVDAGFLASGVATDERTRIEGALTRAEALYEAQEDEEAAEAFDPLPGAARSTGVPELQVRALVGSGLAKMRIGDHRGALVLLNEARAISEAEAFSDVERADVLLRLGGCRVQLNSIQTALGLLNEAMGLAERSGLPCDALKANILSWRARCWLIQRDYQAAKEDVERALELAHAVDDLRTVGAAYFQASLVADREGRWVLARNYAERAREAYAQLADRVHVGQLTNNLGGLNFLLGNTDDAIELLDGRIDYVDETGNAHLVLGRALLEQGRLDDAEAAFAAAENSFGELGSASHRAASWMARGDLAARRGDHERAAELYRTAAEALQDVRF